jgi:hypothetical protein
MTPGRKAEKEFEPLLDLLASDGAEPEPPSGDDGAGSRKVNDADGVQRGLNGRLDLG